MLYIAVTSRSVAASIVSLNWVQDGVHDVEAGAFRWMKNIGSTRVASSVVSLGWVEDGIDEIEVKAIENVSYIADKNAKEALRIVGMSFLESIGRECTSHNDILFMLEADPRKSNVGTEEFLES